MTIPNIKNARKLLRERDRGTQFFQSDSVADDSPNASLENSDDALALAFTLRYQHLLRFTAAWHKWHEWDETRWREDTTLIVFDKVRALCREIAADANPKKAAGIASASTIASVERLARADRTHAARPEQWDSDPWLICTPSGVIELTSGVLRPARPDDYLTKQCAVAPNGECSQWLAFLDWATGGDSELVQFIQRVAGYSLTGSIREHALFFCYGTGGNGKGTALNTLTGILGDYSAIAPIDTFTEARGERHPTDLAMLRGARLVASQETERGRRWAESRIKALTGGDPITARFMRQDFFTFAPEFKLVIAGNEKPAIGSVDEAIRRRLHLIPFEQQITPERRDENLHEKLKAEWPGILNWMVEGCLLWQETGLKPPSRVQAATQAYLDEQDSFGAWQIECCNESPRDWESTANLYQSWVTWSTSAGEKSGSQKEFTQELRKRGLSPQTSGHSKTRGWAGLSLKENSANAYKS